MHTPPPSIPECSSFLEVRFKIPSLPYSRLCDLRQDPPPPGASLASPYRCFRTAWIPWSSWASTGCLRVFSRSHSHSRTQPPLLPTVEPWLGRVLIACTHCLVPTLSMLPPPIIYQERRGSERSGCLPKFAQWAWIWSQSKIFNTGPVCVSFPGSSMGS